MPVVKILTEYKAYMRYAGQGEEIPVVLSPEVALRPDAATLQRRFEEDYVALFSRTVEGMDVEVDGVVSQRGDPGSTGPGGWCFDR